MNTGVDVLLASGSPRRRELLSLIGVRFLVYAADIDESRQPGESPADYVLRLAVEKAQAGQARQDSDLPALGADTIVLLDDEILGKPRSRAHAREMLQRLSGNCHEVYSGVALVRAGGFVGQRLNRTRVCFGEIPAPWIEQYCAGDEPMDKAGAYAVQGLAAQWVSQIDGSYSGVMGLPLFETAALLREAGVSLGQAAGATVARP